MNMNAAIKHRPRPIADNTAEHLVGGAKRHTVLHIGVIIHQLFIARQVHPVKLDMGTAATVKKVVVNAHQLGAFGNGKAVEVSVAQQLDKHTTNMVNGLALEV